MCDVWCVTCDVCDVFDVCDMLQPLLQNIEIPIDAQHIREAYRRLMNGDQNPKPQTPNPKP